MLPSGLTRATTPFTIFATAALLFAAPAAQAAQPHYGDVAVVASNGGDSPREVFARDTPKISVRAQLVDVPTGAKLAGAWIAGKTEVAPPDYKIDTAELTAGALMNQAVFGLSKPNAGWPVGVYRVELSINGQVINTVHFKVE